MEDLQTTVENTLASLSLNIQQDLGEKYQLILKEDEDKKSKKKNKKYQIEAEDSAQKALQKVNKLLEQLYKSYQSAGKTFGKVRQFKIVVDGFEKEKEKMSQQKKMIQNLFNGFKKKYEGEVANAQKVEKEEEEKRKAIIEELQQRIKTVQGRYEEAGKGKIEKYKENETLKHQLSKCEPHLVASESLADAQLKKKSIQIQIHMTTLKQKIQMMDNFKTMRSETEGKLKKSQEVEEKLALRLKKLQAKEEDHKIALAKAHLVFEDYKKAFNVLKETLPKKQRDALLSKDRLKKSDQSLQELRRKLTQLDIDYETQTKQLQVLQNLEKQLVKQLEE